MTIKKINFFSISVKQNADLTPIYNDIALFDTQTLFK